MLRCEIAFVEDVMQYDARTYTVIGCALAVHRELPPGYLESVYQNALAYELRSHGVSVECEVPLQVRYRGIVVGTFSADLLVERRLLVETKAVRALVAAHEAQVVNYLATTGLDTGLLLNFGSSRLEIRHKWRVHQNG